MALKQDNPGRKTSRELLPALFAFANQPKFDTSLNAIEIPSLDSLTIPDNWFNGFQDAFQRVSKATQSVRGAIENAPKFKVPLQSFARHSRPNLPSLDGQPLQGFSPVTAETWKNTVDHLIKREGYSNKAYYDSEGHLTIGVGHKVLPGEGITEGTVISDARVRQLLEQDAGKAYRAAIARANDLGINDSQFVTDLTSKAFQSGAAWHHEHKDTWALMKAGKFKEAAIEAANSKWARQTPVRLADFQKSLLRIDKLQQSSTTALKKPGLDATLG